MDTTRTFLSWYRQGLGTLLEADLKADKNASDKRARVMLSVRAQINSELADTDPTAVPPKFYLHGPGDVLGFDPALVVSVWPPHQSSGAQPNFFPTIEFALPDLPWAFSPAAPKNNQLMPWLCLVAIEKHDGQLVAAGAGQPLPLLRVKSKELPLLQAESWAWAHVQITHDASATMTDKTIAAYLEKYPERALSRLMCPRKLASSTSYLACVVPVFEDGVAAGGGVGNPSADTAALAWVPVPDAEDKEITLPVYYSWEFSTGIKGDFKQLGRQLVPFSPAEPVGTRPLDIVTLAGQGLTASATNAELLMGGALGVSPAATFKDVAFQDRLAALLNARTRRPVDSTLVIAPPTYGASHAAASVVDSVSKKRTPWLNELNLDPRLRVAAALGTRIVQERQADLMARAWQQVGEIQAANQIIRQGQLALTVGKSLHAQLAGTDNVACVALTAPVHLRVPAPAGTVAPPTGGALSTVTTAITASRVPQAAFTGAFRRVLRPRGPLARRAAHDPSGIAHWNERLLDRLNGGASGAAKSNVALDRDASAALFPSQTDNEKNAQLTRFLATQPAAQSVDEKRFLIALLQSLRRVVPLSPRDGEPFLAPVLDFKTLADGIKSALDPEKTVLADVNARLTLPGGPLERLDVIMAAPEFPEPMYEALLELSPEWMLPGIGGVPPNTISGLYPCNEFVEAFMVGLNHEMGRELLWRGYPTDQRGTCFKQFWDPSGKLASITDREKLNDIQKPIHEWRADLGQHLATGSTGFVVLMVRGELLQRFPRAAIYLIGATRGSVEAPDASPPRTPDVSATPLHPEFRAFLAPDVTFLGFRIGPGDAKGDPGYFLVIEQPPMEPRFGLDEPPEPPVALGANWSWSDLHWNNVKTTATGHIRLSDGLTGVTPPDDELKWWGSESAASRIASLTMQTAVRIAIHASKVLP